MKCYCRQNMLRASWPSSLVSIPYKAAAIPAAMAPSTIKPFEIAFEEAAPVDEALAADAVALAVLDPEAALLLEDVSDVAAPKRPP